MIRPAGESRLPIPGHALASPIIIKVGDTCYATRIETLTGRSNYFKAFFSKSWPGDKQENRSIHIEGDPYLFDYIIEYLRRGTFPLDFNPTRGHNYGLYARLLQEAKYFQCPHLFTFLEDQCFQKCVTWEITNEIYDCQTMGSLYDDTDIVDVQFVRTKETEVKTCLCPRRIKPHYGKPEFCGRQCKKVLADCGYENDIHTIPEYAIVKRKLKFNLEWISDDGQEFINHLQEKKAYDESGSSCTASGNEGNLELNVNATPLNHHPGEGPILNGNEDLATDSDSGEEISPPISPMSGISRPLGDHQAHSGS
ncbi:hypothetical protein GX48_02670 [Paracoccidioides brasiliensis]|nr:hypothetical protein GX48_02670 [Paracoccidioides brasiliensis]